MILCLALSSSLIAYGKGEQALVAPHPENDQPRAATHPATLAELLGTWQIIFTERTDGSSERGAEPVGQNSAYIFNSLDQGFFRYTEDVPTAVQIEDHPDEFDNEDISRIQQLPDGTTSVSFWYALTLETLPNGKIQATMPNRAPTHCTNQAGSEIPCPAHAADPEYSELRGFTANASLSTDHQTLFLEGIMQGIAMGQGANQNHLTYTLDKME